MHGELQDARRDLVGGVDVGDHERRVVGDEQHVVAQRAHRVRGGGDLGQPVGDLGELVLVGRHGHPELRAGGVDAGLPLDELQVLDDPVDVLRGLGPLGPDPDQLEDGFDVTLGCRPEVRAGAPAGGEELAVAGEGLDRPRRRRRGEGDLRREAGAVEYRGDLFGVFEHPVELGPVLPVDQLGEQPPRPLVLRARRHVRERAIDVLRHGGDGGAALLVEVGEQGGQHPPPVARGLRPRRERAQLRDLDRVGELRPARQDLLTAGAALRRGGGEEPPQLAQLSRGGRGEVGEVTADGGGRQRGADGGELLRPRAGDDDAAAIGEQRRDGPGRGGGVEVLQDDQRVVPYRRDQRRRVVHRPAGRGVSSATEAASSSASLRTPGGVAPSAIAERIRFRASIVGWSLPAAARRSTKTASSSSPFWSVIPSSGASSSGTLSSSTSSSSTWSPPHPVDRWAPSECDTRGSPAAPSGGHGAPERPYTAASGHSIGVHRWST
ncbi:hypothetical protein BJF90_29285 [Pseudonocardia sp. CNS-004]|nr:hypothetical protein BJF90_29285 [Pseudonocardia sp. CNS-004]